MKILIWYKLHLISYQFQNITYSYVIDNKFTKPLLDKTNIF